MRSILNEINSFKNARLLIICTILAFDRKRNIEIIEVVLRMSSFLKTQFITEKNIFCHYFCYVFGGEEREDIKIKRIQNPYLKRQNSQ